MDWAYTDKVKDHFMDPRNVLKEDDVSGYDGRATVGNLKCGDQMMMVIKVDGEKGVITDCKWKTYGCASAIASTSVLSEMVKGMKVEDAYNISPEQITEELGALPEHKIHCSVLGDKALRAAINDYYTRSGDQDKIVEDEERTICQCMSVTDREIEHAALEGARTYLELQERTKLGTVCGNCKDEALGLFEGYIKEHFGNGTKRA